MASYIVMEPPGARAADPAEKAAFIRDGFAWLGFLVPAFWLLWYRLWIEAGICIIALVGLTAAFEAAGLGWAGPLFSLLVSVFVGLEGPALRVASLERRGWRSLGVFEAANHQEAALRLILEREGVVSGPVVVAHAPVQAAPAPPQAASPARPAGHARPPAPSFGLIPYPRKP